MSDRDDVWHEEKVEDVQAQKLIDLPATELLEDHITIELGFAPPAPGSLKTNV